MVSAAKARNIADSYKFRLAKREELSDLILKHASAGAYQLTVETRTITEDLEDFLNDNGYTVKVERSPVAGEEPWVVISW